MCLCELEGAPCTSASCPLDVTPTSYQLRNERSPSSASILSPPDTQSLRNSYSRRFYAVTWCQAAGSFRSCAVCTGRRRVRVSAQGLSRCPLSKAGLRHEGLHGKDSQHQDYREDGMDLGSDACSRSSSESSSSKVTPCSDCKSSPSLELAALEDYEEDFVDKVSNGWEDEDDEGIGEDRFPKDNCFGRVVSGRSLAEEFEDAKSRHLSSINGNPSHQHKLNGNLFSGKSNIKGKPSPPKPQNNSFRGTSLHTTGDTGAAMREEPQLPTMDWEALEKHLAGLQLQEQEARNQRQTRSNYTSCQVPASCHKKPHE